MKGYIFVLALLLSSTSFADYTEKTMTTSERRRRDSVHSLQESFIDIVYGFSYAPKRPMNSFALTLTKSRFLYFIEETEFDYGTKNFLKRVDALYTEIEKSLNLTLSEEFKTVFTDLLIDHALPSIHYGNSRCTVLLQSES